ncbi:MAG TPA: winged helix-turn-helix domain-containing protein [Pyrinomonadaceae bacterium]|nr:winged helix-turn-helix domain-containing protein [Pyrinomonadaceae bacterium]
MKPEKHFYEFGPFRVDASRRRLLRAGEVVALTPKAFDTLLVLVENGGRVVEKDELMEKVWPGVSVEENNLTQNISALRKALGERREEPQYIATVSGLGYRFIASVDESWPDDEGSRLRAPDESVPLVGVEKNQVGKNQIEKSQVEKSQTGGNGFTHVAVGPHAPTATAGEGVEASRRRRGRALVAAAFVAVLALAGGYYLFARRAKPVEATSGPNARVRSIAILPFKPLGSEGPDEFFGLGMADALITKLSSIRQISVRPTSAILKFANAEQDPSAAGRELLVDSVLDGRVQKSGERIRVTVQLVRAGDGATLWAEQFDEKYTDIFAVEDRISEQVVQALLPTLTGAQKQQLAKHYTEDTEAYQSYIKGRYYWNKRTAEDIKKAISYFEDAILQDPNYALAYAGLADSYATVGVLDDVASQETMPKARSAAMKALELDEGLAEAHASLGYVKHRYEWDWPGAEREFKRAIELNPGYATAHQWYGWYLVTLGSFDGALAQFKLANQIDPLSLYTNLTVGAPYFYSRQYDKAAEQYRRVTEMNPDFWLGHWWLARTFEQEGKYEEALAELQKMAKIRGGDAIQSTAAGYIYALAGKRAERSKSLKRRGGPRRIATSPLTPSRSSTRDLGKRTRRSSGSKRI